MSDAILGVIIGWGLATLTAVVGGGINAFHQRRAARKNQKAAARLILEELRVAQRAVGGEDRSRLVAGIDLPTRVWSQRRESLVDTDEWTAIADAFSAIDDLNAARAAQLRWRSESTAEDLQRVREGAVSKLETGWAALRRLGT